MGRARGLIEFIVGVFIILGVLALFMLAFKVSGLSEYSARNSIYITATFNNIGDLKVRAPVKIAGVSIGEVSAISLNPNDFRATVTMLIDKNANNLPIDSSASILSASLLGSKYISITPGFETQTLHDGSKITDTNSAVILENLIGQAIFKPKPSATEEKR